MYPLEIYIVMIVINIALFLYMIYDLKNLKYGNIISGGLASFIAMYLALVSVSGTIEVGTRVAMFNTTDANYTTITYLAPDLMQDDGLMWFWIIIAVIQTIITVYLTLEAHDEWQLSKNAGGE